jgi:hypothetical protein
MAGFATLLGIAAEIPPTTTEDIKSPLSLASSVRRRGRATGLTTARFSHEVVVRCKRRLRATAKVG